MTSAGSIFNVSMFVGSLEFCRQTDRQNDYSNPPLHLRGRGLMTDTENITFDDDLACEDNDQMTDETREHNR